MISLSHQGEKNNLEKGNAIESGLTFFFLKLNWYLVLYVFS